MVHRVFWLFSRCFHRRVSHFEGRPIRQIIDASMKIYSDFLGRLIFRSAYMRRYAVYIYYMYMCEHESV